MIEPTGPCAQANGTVPHPVGSSEARSPLPADMLWVVPREGLATIILAHEPTFRIGCLEIRPATRTVARNGVETVLEPRVMQVLVALARANGAVVSRDDLIESCWQGRVVGDDAINRVLSRLRRLEEDLARNSFSIETITRIGYRLVRHDGETTPLVPDPRPNPARLSRRAVLGLGLGGTAIAAAGGAGWWIAAHRAPPLPAGARQAMARGDAALREMTPDQTSTAIAAYREATELAPRSAAPWGALALAYHQQLRAIGTHNAIDEAQTEQRLRAAAARALTIDPGNPDALTALAAMLPMYRHWFDVERALLPVATAHPHHGPANRMLGMVDLNVGRMREAAVRLRTALETESDWPQAYTRLIFALWGMGDIDQADAVMARAYANWPRHYSIWFTRERLLAYTGRAEAALAMFADRAGRPLSISEENFAMSAAEVRALGTREAADIDQASRLMIEWAHRGAGFAANAIMFHTEVGRMDDAFRLMDAYFFDRGFTVGPRRYSEEQGFYDIKRDRETSCLFCTTISGLRSDPRFGPMIREIGLSDYWRLSGTRPDVGAIVAQG